MSLREILNHRDTKYTEKQEKNVNESAASASKYTLLKPLQTLREKNSATTVPLKLCVKLAAKVN